MSFESLPNIPAKIALLEPAMFDSRVAYLTHNKKVPQRRALEVALKFDRLYAKNSIGLVDQCWEMYLKDAQRKFDRATLRRGCFYTAYLILSLCLCGWVMSLLGRQEGFFILVQLFVGIVGGSSRGWIRVMSF